MAHQRLHHYLRTYRRRFGFSQEEIAGLLGASSGTKVSRYEAFRRMPSVITVFAYEIIFDQPIRELFAGAYAVSKSDVQARAARLLKVLSKARDPRIVRKVARLQAIIDAK